MSDDEQPKDEQPGQSRDRPRRRRRNPNKAPTESHGPDPSSEQQAVIAAAQPLVLLRLTVPQPSWSAAEVSYAFLGLSDSWTTINEFVRDNHPQSSEFEEAETLTVRRLSIASPLIATVSSAMAGGAGLYAMRILATALRDPVNIGGYLLDLKRGWLQAENRLLKEQIKHEQLVRKLQGALVQIPQVSSADVEMQSPEGPPRLGIGLRTPPTPAGPAVGSGVDDPSKPGSPGVGRSGRPKRGDGLGPSSRFS